jgi:hypothetical protein
MATVGGNIVNLFFRMPYFMASPDSKDPDFARMKALKTLFRGVHGRHHV